MKNATYKELKAKIEGMIKEGRTMEALRMREFYEIELSNKQYYETNGMIYKALKEEGKV